MPAAILSLIYFSIDFPSGCDRLYSLLIGREAPGKKSIAKSYGLLVGSDSTKFLLNSLAGS